MKHTTLYILFLLFNIVSRLYFHKSLRFSEIKQKKWPNNDQMRPFYQDMGTFFLDKINLICKDDQDKAQKN